MCMYGYGSMCMCINVDTHLLWWTVLWGYFSALGFVDIVLIVPQTNLIAHQPWDLYLHARHVLDSQAFEAPKYFWRFVLYVT